MLLLLLLLRSETLANYATHQGSRVTMTYTCFMPKQETRVRKEEQVTTLTDDHKCASQHNKPEPPVTSCQQNKDARACVPVKDLLYGSECLLLGWSCRCWLRFVSVSWEPQVPQDNEKLLRWNNGWGCGGGGCGGISGSYSAGGNWGVRAGCLRCRPTWAASCRPWSSCTGPFHPAPGTAGRPPPPGRTPWWPSPATAVRGPGSTPPGLRTGETHVQHF